MELERVINYIENKKPEYRAWDKVQNKMVYNVVPFVDGNIWEKYDEGDGDELIGDFILMQFVGRYDDSTNRKIFDGDIIEGTRVLHDGIEPYIVKERGIVVFTYQGVLVFLPHRSFDIDLYSDIKVLGNIYQHKDLLNKIWG